MPKIKMRKGYPTSDGVMHDKHADAVKAQVGLNIDHRLKETAEKGEGNSSDTLDFIDKNPDIVSDYIKYFHSKPKPAAPKKKTTAKK